jgi:Spy/CpxP family protein refolding chaperone
MGQRPGPSLLKFLNLEPAQEKAVQAILDQHRASQSLRRRALADREAALRGGMEDPALSEAQIRALLAAETEARLQVVLEERAAFLDINRVLTADQQTKAARLRQKLEREREARMDLMEEEGWPKPGPGPFPR